MQALELTTTHVSAGTTMKESYNVGELGRGSFVDDCMRCRPWNSQQWMYQLIENKTTMKVSASRRVVEGSGGDCSAVRCW